MAHRPYSQHPHHRGLHQVRSTLDTVLETRQSAKEVQGDAERNALDSFDRSVKELQEELVTDLS